MRKKMRLYQIYEDDLVYLESTLPMFQDIMIDRMDNALRIKFRRLKELLSNIRWNYGPPSDIYIIDRGEENE